MAIQNSFNQRLLQGIKVDITNAAAGDLLIRDGSGLLSRIGIGSTGQVLKVNGGMPEWAPEMSAEDIQDLIGDLFGNTSTVTFSYDDNGNAMTADLNDGSVTNAKLRDSAATTIMGRSAGTTGSPSDIAFTADRQVLLREEGTLQPLDFDAEVRTSRLDQMAAPTSAVSFNSQKITNLATPTASGDAVTKSYVDNAFQGSNVKTFVRAASTGNINLAAPGTTIDGIAMEVAESFLAKDQTDASENGIYDYNGPAAAATRRADADSELNVLPGMTVFVDEGTVNADTNYQLVTNGPIVLDDTDLVFTVFGRVESITVSSPLERTGNDIAIQANGIQPSNLQQLPQYTLFGNDGDTTADGQYLSVSDVLTLLGLTTAAKEAYVPVSATAATMAANTAYRPGNAALTTLSLPATCEEGAKISVEGRGAGGWKIAQGAGQQIIYGDMSTTSGASGYLASLNAHDVVTLRCIVADTVFQVVSTVGNLEVI